MTEVKPCPHCGTAWVFYDDLDDFEYRINCQCGFAYTHSEWCKNEEDAINAWNRRISDG